MNQVRAGVTTGLELGLQPDKNRGYIWVRPRVNIGLHPGLYPGLYPGLHLGLPLGYNWG